MIASRSNHLSAGGDVPFQFTVSPDFSPRLAPGWYVFNTWLQRVIGQAVEFMTGRVDSLIARPV